MLFHVYLVICIAILQPASSQSTCKVCEGCNVTMSALCNCDQDCGNFRDCCNSVLPPSTCPLPSIPITLVTNVVTPECHSIYLNPIIQSTELREAFLMVANCPPSPSGSSQPPGGNDSAAAITCASMRPDLPPVTDRDTGIVYRNEHCALCNGVNNLVAWQVNLACSDNVYTLLENFPIADILARSPDIFSTDCQGCTYQVPTMSNQQQLRTPRPCFPNVGSCRSQTELANKVGISVSDETYAALTQTCQSGPQNLLGIPGSSNTYRNSACVLCNGEDDEITTCLKGLETRKSIPLQCAPVVSQTTTGSAITNIRPIVTGGIPFTITLSNLNGGQVQITAMSSTASVFVNCSEGEVPVGLSCRPTQCPEGYVEFGGRCGSSTSFPPSPPPLGGSGNNPQVIDFLKCPTALVPLNSSEFEDRGNGTIFYNGKVVQVQFYDGNNRPLVCPDNTSLVHMVVNTTIISLLPGIGELTLVGCSLSVLGTMLILLTYGMFAELRTLPSLLLMNLALAILVTNLLFLIGGPVVQHFPRADLCTAAAVCLHFFYLAQFSWMTLFSVEMAHTFYLAKKMVGVSNRKKRCILLIYMLIGWGLPLGISIVTIGLNFGGSGLVLYGVTSDGRVGSCWINHFVSFVVSFLVPLVLSLVANLGLLVLVTVLLCQAMKKKSQQTKVDHYTLLRVWLAMFSITGLTWLFGFLAIPNETSWAWYPFVILNSSQGFFVFLSFLCTRKIFKLYYTLLKCKGEKATQRHVTKTRETSTPFNKELGLKKSSSNLDLRVPAVSIRRLSLPLHPSSGHLDKDASESKETILMD